MRTRIVLTLVIVTFVLISVLEVQAQGQFVGSKNSNIYHYPSCSYAQRIKPENQVWFDDAADALAHGYVPCQVCNPPVPEMTPLGFLLISIILMGTIVIFRKRGKSVGSYPTSREVRENWNTRRSFLHKPRM